MPGDKVMRHEPPVRIGVVGTGFVARHFLLELRRRPAYRLGRVLTRRPPESCTELPVPREALTGSVAETIEHADIVFECTGDVPWAAVTIGAALAAGKPVVTLNPEFHVTVGSAFVGRGLLTEAEGDQPGSEAALWEEAVAMGFEPLVLGNMKGFLNRTPTPEDMRYWAERQGLSLPMVTSFTDGTKLQVEQALVGNFFGADIAQEELLGPATDDLAEATRLLGEAATALGRPITDYVLSRRLPHGVFVVARHEAEQRDALRYLKMGDGPFYTLVKPNILVHLEVFKTLERVLRQGRVLLDNSARPRLSVAAVTKRELLPGEQVARGAGSFAMRGICVRIADHPGHLPIGLAEDVRIRRRVEPGRIVGFDDVEIADGPALAAWRSIVQKVTSREKAA